MFWSKICFLKPKVRKIMFYQRDIHKYINLSLNLDEKIIYECSIGFLKLWECLYESPLTSNKNRHLFWINFCCTLYLSSKTHNVRIFMQLASCIKIRTLWVLGDKCKVQQKGIQYRCLLLLNVNWGSYEHSQSFTKPMAY